MYLWGIAADIAIGENHNFSSTSLILFDQLIKKFIKLDPEEIATQTYQLFGYSAESGIQIMSELIKNKSFDIFVNLVIKRIRKLKGLKINIPLACDLYTNLYTIDIVNDKITYLND